MRYFLTFQYKGTAYHGWQIQPNAKTVQEELQQAMEVILREKVELTAAGRTDTGVHAKRMVAHFDCDENLVIDKIKFKLNSYLGKDISILGLRAVSSDAHARFDALSRTYHYKIHFSKNPFLKEFSYRIPFDLDFIKMNEAASLLLGKKDFSCFSKSNTQTYTNDCEIFKAEWKKENDFWCFEIKANRFLRNMVRAIVGTLIEIGQGKRSVESLKELIDSKDRSAAGSSVPAHGLYLIDIDYPNKNPIEVMDSSSDIPLKIV